MKRHFLTFALLATVAVGGAFASNAGSEKRLASDYLTLGSVTCMPIPETDCIVGAPNPCLVAGSVYDISTPTGCANLKGRF